MDKARRAIGLAWAASLATVLGAAGQAPAVSLEGMVRDSLTNRPIGGVMLRLESGAQAVTDDGGRFRFAELERGRHLLAVLTHDCRINWIEVDLSRGDVSGLEVRLAPAYGTTAAARREEEERRRSEGRVLTAAEIDRIPARTLTDVIRRVAPRMVGSPSAEPGGVTPLAGRSRSTLTTSQVAPVVVVDGIRSADGANSLQVIRPWEVETLEILPSAAAGWEFGSAGSGGVIKVTTRRGRETLERTEPRACVVPGFPVGRTPSR